MKIWIGTPGTTFGVDYVQRLLWTMDELRGAGHSVEWVTAQSSDVGVAREIVALGGMNLAGMVHDFSDEARDWRAGLGVPDVCVWIDSDISWEPLQVRQLVMRVSGGGRDFVSGVYALGETGRRVAVSLRDWSRCEGMDLALAGRSDDGLVRVQGVGLGFCAMRGDLLTWDERPWFQRVQIKVSGRFVDLGEDYSFCERLGRNVNLWVDPELRVGHVKSAVWTVV